MAKIIPITEHFQHFLAEMKESFWGDLYGQTQLAWQRFFELQSERERDRFSGAGRYERRRGRRRIYRNGYYERDFVTRFGTIRLRIAHPREELSAGGAAAISAAGRRSFVADPGSVSSRDQHPAGRAGGGHHHGRDGKCADRVQAYAGSGRGGAAVSSGPVERRLCLSISGRGELAGAAAGGTQAGTDAGGVWDPAGWQPTLAGFLAQPGRRSGGLGRLATGSLPARTGRPIARSDSHRWLCRVSGGDSDGLSASPASTLLGA